MIQIVGLIGGVYALFRCIEIMFSVGANKDMREGAKTLIIIAGVLTLIAEFFLMTWLLGSGA